MTFGWEGWRRGDPATESVTEPPAENYEDLTVTETKEERDTETLQRN